MNRTAFVCALLIAIGSTSRADECALVSLKVGKEKQILQFAMEFHEGDAPGTVANFKKLARKGFYEDTAIHRAFPHMLVQMGDPLSKKKDRSRVGTGGPGYSLPPEIRGRHVKGAVVAGRLPDKVNPSRVSNGSQFFICLQPMPEYDGQYTVFGNVLWGMETLDALSTKPTDTNDFPTDRIEIRSIKIVDRSQLPAPPKPSESGSKPTRRWWQFFG